MNKYLATDLDGTILIENAKTNYVSKENKQVINLFNKQVIIVSGRGEEFVRNVCLELGIEQNFIACNGAIIVYNGKVREKHFISNKLLKEIIAYIENNFIDYYLVLFDSNSKLYSLSSNESKAREREENNLTNSPLLGYTTNKDRNYINTLLDKDKSFIKVNAILNKKEKMELFAFLKSKNYNLDYVICPNSIEITDFNVNKGKSLLKLLKIMKVETNNVIVVGDDNNDLEMFKCFKNSYLINKKYNHHLTNKVSIVLNSFKELKNYLKE